MIQNDKGSYIEKSALENRAESELSSVEADRLALEHNVETEAAILEAGTEKATAPVTATPLPTSSQIQMLEKDQVTVEVEGILEKDLKDIYQNLPDNLKPFFKSKGEETANTISQMIKKAAVKVGEVMDLIFSWLRIIPGLNRYYLEQEAKIKADRIIALNQEIEKEKLAH